MVIITSYQCDGYYYYIISACHCDLPAQQQVVVDRLELEQEEEANSPDMEAGPQSPLSELPAQPRLQGH